MLVRIDIIVLKKVNILLLGKAIEIRTYSLTVLVIVKPKPSTSR